MSTAGPWADFIRFCEEQQKEEACNASLAQSDQKPKTFSVTHPHTRVVHQIPDDGSPMSERFREDERRRVAEQGQVPPNIYFGTPEGDRFLADQTRRMANSHATC